MKTIKVFTDGGSRNNPGDAAIGVVAKDKNNKPAGTFKKYIGVRTNNQAEYEAIITALERLKGKAEIIDCYLDSQLVVNQAKGIYKVKNSDIRELLLRLKTAEAPFKEVHYTLIPREQNKEADRLVNEALDEHLS